MPEESLKLRPELDLQYRLFCDRMNQINHIEDARELAKDAYRLYLATRQTISLVNGCWGQKDV